MNQLYEAKAKALLKTQACASNKLHEKPDEFERKQATEADKQLPQPFESLEGPIKP